MNIISVSNLRSQYQHLKFLWLQIIGKIPSQTIRKYLYIKHFQLKIGNDTVIYNGCHLRDPNKIIIGNNTSIDDRWKQGCGKCPDLNTYPAVRRDSTDWEWKLKNWVYSRSNLSVVTPSKWLTEQVKQSMLNRFPIHQIPSGIDTEAYQPIDSEKCRYILNIPNNKRVLMFGAENINDSRKGGDLLAKALTKLPESLKAETVLLTFGYGGETISNAVGIETVNLGYISSDHLKSIAYSAADLFIFPTRADNLPLVLQESMACGTPMVSFKIGGVPDLVRHNITGYLATPEDSNDFCQGIIQLLEDNQLRAEMKQNCRAISLDEYSLEIQTQQYLKIYQKILS